MAQQSNLGFFKSREDIVSMFLGLVVVVALVGFVVNFIEKRKGNVDVPGISNNSIVQEEIKVGNGINSGSIKVEKNDSLWKIAVRVYNDGYKWTEIAKANNLNNPSLIYVGQELKIPSIEKVETKTLVDEKITITSEKTEYKVVANDSLWKIAVRVYNDGYKWTKIWQDNKDKINDPDKLEKGMVLTVYGKI